MNFDDKRRVSLVAKKAALATLISAIVGCGGGGGGHHGNNATSPGTVNNGGGGNTGQVGVNGELTGVIYYDDITGEHLKLNLVTGIESKMSSVSSYWEAFSKGVTDYDIDEAHQRFVVTRSLSLWDNGPDQIQIYSLDKNYQLIDNFVLEGHFVNSFHVSPNGKYVSMTWKKEWDGPTYFSIFDISGNELIELYENECSACHGHVWKKDSAGVILAVDTSMSFLNVDELSKVNEVKFRDFYDDNILPFSISISPDGLKLAFTASTGPNEEDTHIFVMNIDGTGLRQITDGRMGEWRVKWAKNGNGLFAVSGYKHLTEPVTTCIDELYWVSESADKVELPNDYEADSDSSKVKRIVRNNSNQSVGYVCAVDVLRDPWEL